MEGFGIGDFGFGIAECGFGSAGGESEGVAPAGPDGIMMLTDG